MPELQALCVEGRRSPVRSVPALTAGHKVRDLLRTTLDEPELSAAVRAASIVVEDYVRRADAIFGPVGPTDDDVTGSWPAVRLAMSRGVPAAVLQRSLWEAHLRLLDRLLGTAMHGSELHPLRQLSTVVTQGLASLTASCCQEVATVYAGPERARPEQAGTEAVPDGQDRRQLLVRVLTDRHMDDAEAERALGLRLSDHHWAAVLWSAPDSGLEVEDLVRFALTATRAVGGYRPVVTVNRASEVWMWISWPTPPAQEAITSAYSRMAVPEGLRVSTGPILTGLTGFRRSMAGARAAQRSADQVTDSWWCDYEDVSPVSLLTNDKEQARWFTEEVLGELGRDHPWYATLRETLRLYLAHGRSRQQVAAAMYINRNTVAYRVQKASRLLGRPIEEDAFDVRLALEIARATVAR